jgi:hypothetical protein
MELDTDTLLYLLLPPRSPASSTESDDDRKAQAPDDGGGNKVVVKEELEPVEAAMPENNSKKGDELTGQFPTHTYTHLKHM